MLLNQLPEVTLSYIESALFTTEVGADFAERWLEDTGHVIPPTAPILRRFGFTPASLHWSARARIEADCEAFVLAHLADLAELDADDVGRDLWLTRNGFDGFAARDIGPVGDRLAAAALALGPSELVIGDDRQLHLSGT